MMAQRVGLLGWPLGHSVSPAMHNAAFEALGLDWRYEALAVPPERLAERVSVWLADGYRGFNVTVPHKRAVLGLQEVTQVDPAVKAIGAANTLIRQPDGKLGATNTDWRGFADEVQAQGIAVRGICCLVLGTGGSAQAVAYALHRLGAASITFVSRRPTGQPDTIGYEALSRFVEVGLVINCTPVGMAPHVEASPWPDGVPFPKGAAIYDLIYNPPVTRLMAQAREAGAHAVGGLGMLVRQGALSFEQWTGVAPPLDVMERAAQQALSII